ncbi:MAG: hypothetical protein HC893_12875, partial [Chloroflexaceae bacterium]|nr:hypothetical protein [Chloroflexaceae bacterium]
RLFASYVSRVTGSSNEFTLRLTQSTNGGATWAPPGSTRIDRRTWPGPAWIAAINNVAHMAVEQRTSSGSNKRVYHQSFNANTNRYSAFTRVSNNEQSLMPSISIGGGIRFTTFNVGRLLDSVKYNLERANDAPPVTPTRTRTPTPRLPTATPTPPAPNGALVVQGDLGVGRTSSQNVTVSLANVTGSPNEYQLRNDIPNFAPPYSPLTAANIPWVLNNPVGTGCELRSVYGILRNSGNGLSSAALQGRVPL